MKKRTEKVTVMEERNCCIRGYYEYKEVWEVTVRESLVCEREPENASFPYVVAVKKEGNIMRHLPGKVLRVCSLFLRRRGTIEQ